MMGVVEAVAMVVWVLLVVAVLIDTTIRKPRRLREAENDITAIRRDLDSLQEIINGRLRELDERNCCISVPEDPGQYKNPIANRTEDTTMDEKTIVDAAIVSGLYKNTVHVTYCDNTEEDLFSYYNDELVFKANEFIGRTRQSSLDLFHARDIAYLRS